MAHGTNDRELLLQNLKDAGCGQHMIESCVALFQQENTLEMKRLLAKHRRELLEAVHVHQKEIDCLDYLVFRLDQRGTKETLSIQNS